VTLSSRTHTVLTALRFYATGCMQKDVDDLHGISQPSASRSITGVSAAIACVARNYTSLPQSNLKKITQDFGEVANISNVVGCVDGTQIPHACHLHVNDEIR